MNLLYISGEPLETAMLRRNTIQEKLPQHNIILRYLYKDLAPAASTHLRAKDILWCDAMIFDLVYLKRSTMKYIKSARYGVDAAMHPMYCVCFPWSDDYPQLVKDSLDELIEFNVPKRDAR